MSEVNEEPRTPEVRLTSPNGEMERMPPRTTPRPRRVRTGRKRSVFQAPARQAWPVRGLWEAAPKELKEEAHQTSMLILAYWLGKKSKLQVAEELKVKPLRVWQLSQLALSGMLAGLLPQPRKRVPTALFEGRPEESPAALKRRIVKLETELSRTEDLVRVLRTAPWAQPVTESAPKGGPSRGRKRKTRRKASPSTRARTSRSVAPGESPDEGGSGCGG